MVGWNELLKKRDIYPRGSDKWREYDRASLINQMSHKISILQRQLSKMPQWKNKSEFERQDYARYRTINFLTDYGRKQKETWRQRDVRSVRDSLSV